jgi:hypothetical protein
VYTIEASFYGSSNEDKHFTSDDLSLMGQSICQALHLYSALIKYNLMMLASRTAAELKADPEALLSDKDYSGSDSNSPENEMISRR